MCAKSDAAREVRQAAEALSRACEDCTPGLGRDLRQVFATPAGALPDAIAGLMEQLAKVGSVK